MRQRRRTAAQFDEIVRRATRKAATRGGVAAGEQLVADGLTRSSIRRLTGRGWLHDLGGDVFAVGHQAMTARGWRWAALLSGGPGAALSYWTAAVLWGLLDRDPAPNVIHVSTVRSARKGCRGARVHRPRTLDAADCATREGLRVTSLFRTLLDLASIADASMLARLVEAAVTIHGVDPLTLAAYARSHPRWPGARRLRETTLEYAGPARLRSDLEGTFRALCRDAGLPEYETNVPFDGKEIDVLYRDRDAAIELNWWTYHGGRTAYRRDHAKARALARAGIALFQVAGEDIDDDPSAVIDDVRAFLAHHPPVANPVLRR